MPLNNMNYSTWLITFLVSFIATIIVTDSQKNPSFSKTFDWISSSLVSYFIFNFFF